MNAQTAPLTSAASRPSAKALKARPLPDPAARLCWRESRQPEQIRSEGVVAAEARAVGVR